MDDFGYENTSSETASPTEVTKEEVTDLNGERGEVTSINEPVPAPEPSEEETETKEEELKSNDLVPGTSIEVDGNNYTVDDSGNVIDANGNIFKEAKDVSDWIKSFDKVDETGDKDSITINNVMDAIGYDITDDNDNPIEFENTPDGIKAYVDAVIETSKDEIAEASINSFLDKYPIVSDVLNYYIANGNSLDGYNEVKDRSSITIDKDNEEQQASIIRMAWSEQGRKGSVENYINYLKSTGTLAVIAEEELEGLKETDKERKLAIAKEAERVEQERIQDSIKYWNTVKSVIDSKQIAGYKIPDTIIIERDGKKYSATPNDFYNYLYQVDSKGVSRYQRDLANRDPKEKMHDEILRAYLRFTGGSYSNLVDIAINEKEVNKLRFKSKESRKSSVRINPPKQTSKPKEIDLGY